MKMMLTPNGTRLMFIEVAKKIIKNEAYLTEIDEKIGDGDHGTGMATGFSAVVKVLSTHESGTIEDVFQLVGNTLLDTMGGASGVLFGTLLISGTIQRPSSNCLTSKELASIMRRSLEALKQRGKAVVGDKTMIDALEPAVIALEEAKELPLAESLGAAAVAANAGVEATKDMYAKFGRAKFYGEQVIGFQDAGATSVSLMFEAMSEWVNQIAEKK